MIKLDYGLYCEVYGENIENFILEYVLVNQDLDFAISDIVEETEISKPTVYDVIGKLEKKGVVKKTRVIGKTQLYGLDKENQISKLFIRNFMECLEMATKNKTYTRTSRVAVVCDKKRK